MLNILKNKSSISSLKYTVLILAIEKITGKRNGAN